MHSKFAKTPEDAVFSYLLNLPLAPSSSEVQKFCTLDADAKQSNFYTYWFLLEKPNIGLRNWLTVEEVGMVKHNWQNSQ